MKNRFFSPFFSLLFPLYFLLESQLIWAEDPQILQITERRVNTPSCFGLGLQFYSSVDFLEKEKFCFKLSYEYLSIERSKTFCDKDLPYNPLFYVQDPSILGGDIYSLNICINENYVSIDDSLYPENFDNVSELSLDISYNDEVLEESISIIQEQEYFLGNHEFMGNFKLLSGFKKVRVQDDLASLPRLLFREGSATTIDNELSESDAKDLFSYFIIDITNAGETSFKSESTSFDNTTASQTSFYPLNSRTLNLDNLTKLEYDAWFSYLPTKLEAISQDQCFFVLPGSGHRVGDNYECIRCNFNDDNNTIASHNKSYLIQASSFTSDNLSSGSNDNLSIVKRNFALNRNDGANEFVGLNNTHYYVIFSLFGRDNETDRNMIRYNLDNGTASNVAVGTGSIDSRFMCRTFKPRKDYTFLEYLCRKQFVPEQFL